MHRSRLQVVLIDHPPGVADDGCRFWARAIGQHPDARPQPDSPYTRIAELGNGVVLVHQRLGAGAPRVHLDIETDDVEAEVRRLEALGAERVALVEGWWQMRDPAGLLFCVVPVQSTDFPAHSTEWSDDEA